MLPWTEEPWQQGVIRNRIMRYCTNLGDDGGSRCSVAHHFLITICAVSDSSGMKISMFKNLLFRGKALLLACTFPGAITLGSVNVSASTANTNNA